MTTDWPRETAMAASALPAQAQQASLRPKRNAVLIRVFRIV